MRQNSLYICAKGVHRDSEDSEQAGSKEKNDENDKEEEEEEDNENDGDKEEYYGFISHRLIQV